MNPRHGAIAATPPTDADGLIDFPEGLPGLEEMVRCQIVRHEDLDPILLLQDADHGDVCLPVVLAKAMWPGYCLDIPGADLALLRTEPGALDSLLCLAVITFGAGGAENAGAPGASCNLFAPIVIDPITRRGKQVLQLDSEYPSALRLDPVG